MARAAFLLTLLAAVGIGLRTILFQSGGATYGGDAPRSSFAPPSIWDEEAVVSSRVRFRSERNSGGETLVGKDQQNVRLSGANDHKKQKRQSNKNTPKETKKSKTTTTTIRISSMNATTLQPTSGSPITTTMYVRNKKDLLGLDTKRAKRICAPWTVDMDDWWTHHPDWDVESEDDETFCFSVMKIMERARLMRKLYKLQFVHGDCSKVHTKYMRQSGWGADFSVIADGLLYGLEQNIPFQVTLLPGVDARLGWHYAAMKDGSKPACASRDMFCYFLPLGRCPPGKIDMSWYLGKEENQTMIHWVTEHATRPQQWLRRRIYDYIATRSPPIQQPCAVMHVRRADVVLHESHSRKYFAVEQYLARLRDESEEDIKNILLLTDDANAIDEALEFHPDYHWMYFNRTRFRGTEGGWENQIPSKDPVQDVVSLLAELRLAQQCYTIVYGISNFATLLKRSMNYADSRDPSKVTEIRVDEALGKNFKSARNRKSAEELAKRLAARRNKDKKPTNDGKRKNQKTPTKK